MRTAPVFGQDAVKQFLDKQNQMCYNRVLHSGEAVGG